MKTGHTCYPSKYEARVCGQCGWWMSPPPGAVNPNTLIPQKGETAEQWRLRLQARGLEGRVWDNVMPAPPGLDAPPTYRERLEVLRDGDVVYQAPVAVWWATE